MFKSTLPLIALLASVATPGFAFGHNKTAAAPSFQDMEFQQRRDPLLGSNVVFGDVHHTASDRLFEATQALTLAIPVGATRTDAESVMRNAGAKCSVRAGGQVEQCHYTALETRDEFFDDIRWNVTLDLANDRVADMSIDRTWQRH